MFLNSEAVGVFPTTGRPQKDPLGRLTTEYNLTSLINTLLDVDGFVITNNIDGFDNNSTGAFQFNIKGYIFTIHKIGDFLGSSDLSTFNDLYASIKINLSAGSSTTSTGNENLNKIQSVEGEDVFKVGDENYGKYTGLKFSDSNPTDGSYYLHILKLNSTQKRWYIPEESKIKLKTSKSGDNRSISIDDGVIE